MNRLLGLGYLGSVIANFSYIFATNTRSVYLDIKESKYGDDSAAGKLIAPVGGGLIFAGGEFFAVTKSLIFGLSGPVGSYRIWLAHHNARVTKDDQWVEVIEETGSYVNELNNPYITWPMGNASWKPL